MLVQLIYASRPTTSTVNSTVEAEYSGIESQEISGMLISGKDFYLNLLEGERGIVNRLFQTIIKDPRHTEIVLVRYTEIKAREFPEMGMIRGNIDDLASRFGEQIPVNTGVTYSSLTGVQALALLRRLSILLRIE
jgi:hypothetical protein